MEPLREAKDRVRKAALARRDAMDIEARIEASLAIADNLAPELEFEAGTVVSAFLPIRSEVDLRPLMAALADRRARVCVPAIVGGALEFRELVRGAPLQAQGFGTFAPGRQAAVLDPAIMLVPLSAFDRALHRVGYGRGYYDRAIDALKARGQRPRLIGTAFAAQEVDEVPVESHDERLDLVATEREIVR